MKEMLRTMGTESNLSGLKMSLRKDTEEAYVRFHAFFDRLGDIRSIHSFGFSFSDVDMFYIRKIAQMTYPAKVIWYINQFDVDYRCGSDRSDVKQREQIGKICAMGFQVEVDGRWWSGCRW